MSFHKYNESSDVVRIINLMKRLCSYVMHSRAINQRPLPHSLTNNSSLLKHTSSIESMVSYALLRQIACTDVSKLQVPFN